MAWFVLTWNPDVWRKLTGSYWDGAVANPESELWEIGPWSTGNRRSGIALRDGLIFLRQGRDRGVLAIGEAFSVIYDGEHWRGRDRPGYYVDCLWTTARTIEHRLRTETLTEQIPQVNWGRIRSSGLKIPVAAADQILALWHQPPGPDFG